MSYLGRRLIQVPLVLLVVSLMTFAITRATPGDPVTIMLGMQTSPEAATAMRKEFNLDRSLPEQYGLWIAKVVTGDLGRSMRLNDRVTTLIAERLPISLQLALAGMLFALVVSIPLGVIAALRRNRLDRLSLHRLHGDGFCRAELRPGADPDLCLLDQARLAADHRHRLVRGRARRVVEALQPLHPSRRCARRPADGDADPTAALQHDRHPVAGLHAHRARQGPAAGHHRDRPCAQERDDSFVTMAAVQFGYMIGVQVTIGVHLRGARHGLGGAERRGQPRLPGDPGLHAGDRGLLPADEYLRGHHVRVARSANPILKMAETRALPLQFRGSLALAVQQFPRNRAATIGLGHPAGGLPPRRPSHPGPRPTIPIQIKLSMKLKPPSFEHLMGTDHFGRDVFSRMLWGGRTSLSVGLLVVGFAFVLGVPLGLASGYFGGKVDNVLMRLVDAFLTFPPLLLAVALVGLLGPDIKNVMLALGLVQAPILARMVRGSTLGRARGCLRDGRTRGWAPVRCASCSRTCCATWCRRSWSSSPSSSRPPSCRRHRSASWASARSRRRPAGAAT